MPETIATVRAAFQLQRDAITTLDAALAAESNKLEVDAVDQGRDLTPAEENRLDQISDTRSGLAKALGKLALDTLEALDNASDLNDLLDEIRAVNNELEDHLEHLKIIEEYAEVVANVVAMAEEAVTILAQLRPSLI